MNLKPFRFWKGKILSLSLILSLALVGASPLWAQTAGFAYAANNASNDVSAYTINATTGALTPVPGSPFAAGLNPVTVTVHPSGQFAYVANAFNGGIGDVSAYTINATTGALTPVPGSPFAAGLNPVTVRVHPSGQFAYVTNYFQNDVSAYIINATTGALTPVPGSPFAAGLSPVSVTVHPSGQFAYVANQGQNDVSAYTINATTGALTPVPGSPFAAGFFPVSVTVDPRGKFAYVANYLQNDVSAYTINATTGALTPVPGSPFAAGLNPYDSDGRPEWSVRLRGESILERRLGVHHQRDHGRPDAGPQFALRSGEPAPLSDYHRTGQQLQARR